MISEDYSYNKGEDLNICPICGMPFNEGDRVSVVDFQKGPFRIVHKECDKKTDFQNCYKRGSSSDGRVLKSGDKLWRYMDLSNFISLMKDSALYFSAPSQFNDLYEGAHGELRNKSAWDNYYLSFLRTVIITAPDNCWHKIEPEKLEKNVKDLLVQISRRYEKGVFINCWHLNEFESEAMWKMYSSNVINAVAIQTSYGRLKQELGDRATIKPIKYIDYSKHFVGPNDVFWCKRKSFEYENEVRAIVHDFDHEQETGIKIRVDLNKIIEGVYCSPYSPEWISDILKDLVERYEYKFKVVTSSLIEPPF